MSKRDDLLLVIDCLLAPHACVQGVVAVGSVAAGTAGPRSDIDALVFMRPINAHIVPAESIWTPWDDVFHSIFADDARVHEEGIQLDFKLCDLDQWQRDGAVWTPGQRAGLADAWVAFDRAGELAALIAERTHYDDETRAAQLDDAMVKLEQLLLHDAPERVWEQHGPLIAFDRLSAADDALMQALFALNARWRPWREREMTHALRLAWLPAGFEQRMLVALNAPALDRVGYLTRAAALRAMFGEILAELQREGFYGDDPISDAFVRLHDGEPGRTWNMAEWNAKRHR